MVNKLLPKKQSAGVGNWKKLVQEKETGEMACAAIQGRLVERRIIPLCYQHGRFP